MSKLVRIFLGLIVLNLLACGTSEILGTTQPSKSNTSPVFQGWSDSTPPTPPKWYFEGADKPYPILKNSSYFLLGTDYESEASYLLRNDGAIAKNATLTFKYKIEVANGQPDFVAMETDNQPNSGTIGIIILRNFDDEHGRFWYKTRVNLDPGTYTITAPCTDLASWTSVYGKTAESVTADFYSTLAKAKGAGVTFGGGNHYGHGVRVYGGNAKFTILSMTISTR